jgi:uncharacterized protein YlzI (FlbEa/FlbD family)
VLFFQLRKCWFLVVDGDHPTYVWYPTMEQRHQIFGSLCNLNEKNFAAWDEARMGQKSSAVWKDQSSTPMNIDAGIQPMFAQAPRIDYGVKCNYNVIPNTDKGFVYLKRGTKTGNILRFNMDAYQTVQTLPKLAEFSIYLMKGNTEYVEKAVEEIKTKIAEIKKRKFITKDGEYNRKKHCYQDGDLVIDDCN